MLKRSQTAVVNVSLPPNFLEPPPPDQNQVGERHHDKPHLMSKDRAPAAVVMYVVRMPKLMLTMLMPMLLLLPAACRG